MNDMITEKIVADTIAHIRSLNFSKTKHGKYKHYKTVYSKYIPKSGKTLFISVVKQLSKGQERFVICYWEIGDGAPWWEKREFGVATSIYDIGNICKFAEQ